MDSDNSIENYFPNWELNQKRYPDLPFDMDTYLKYWEEGRQAFLTCLDAKHELNPYCYKASEDKENNHKLYKIFITKGYPWFNGYRYARGEYFWKKYRLEEMRQKIAKIVEEHGLSIDYTDEYCTPFAQTPEGFTLELA
jgi:hypothetical protein